MTTERRGLTGSKLMAPLFAGPPLQAAATGQTPARRGLAKIGRSRATATILWLALGAGVLVFVLPQAKLVADAVEHISTGEPVWLITAGLLVLLATSCPRPPSAWPWGDRFHSYPPSWSRCPARSSGGSHPRASVGCS
jgi:hypothetical protein